MRKILTFLIASVISISTFAQYGPTKFTDNTSVTVKGGVSTEMTDMFYGVSPVVGVEIEKYVTPWLGFAIDGNTLISNPYGSQDPHTAFDVVNVNFLSKVNIINLIHYNGKRKLFEPVLFAGIGWGHVTCEDAELRNYMVTKAGVDLNFHLDKERAWALRLSPAAVWGPVHNGTLNANTGGFEVTVGIAYHFKNSDGNRAYTKITPRSQFEIDNLNAVLAELNQERASLRTDNERLRATVTELSNHEPEVRVDTVYINMDTHEYFRAGSDRIVSMASVRTLVNSLDKTKHYVITGYASEEGSKEFNESLSLRRAQNMYNAMVRFGFPPTNLEVIGAGPTTKFSETDRDANRVVIITNK